MTTDVAQDLVQEGYEAALKLISHGDFDSFPFWKDEALARFRNAILGDGQPSIAWVVKADQDIKRIAGDRFGLQFVGTKETDAGAAVCLELSRGDLTGQFLVYPDGRIKPVLRSQFIM